MKLNFKLNSNKINFNGGGRKSAKLLIVSMSYLFVLVIFPLIFAKKSQFAAFHAKQGLALLVVWVIGIFSFYVPYLPWVIALIILFLVITGISNVLLQKERALPIVGRLAL